jgi:hypothetical protein
MQKTGERGEKAGRLLKYQDLTHKSNMYVDQNPIGRSSRS